MNHAPTTVTALVPAYQAAEFIQPVLDALSAQNRPNFNVIISVDLSTDDTYALCLRHAQRDARFRVVQQTQRLGYVGNCNFLLNEAQCDYVLFAFHDDLLAPTYVEKLCAVLDARPEVIMSFSDVLLTHVQGRQQHLSYTKLEGLQERTARGLKVLHRKGLWWVPNRGIFRLREARKINGLKVHGAGEFSADWPWLFHMSLLGEFSRTPETLCHKFYKPGSLSRGWEFSKTQYLHVTHACGRELQDSELTPGEKRRLGRALRYILFKVRLKLIRNRLLAIVGK